MNSKIKIIAVMLIGLVGAGLIVGNNIINTSAEEKINKTLKSTIQKDFDFKYSTIDCSIVLKNQCIIKSPSIAQIKADAIILTGMKTLGDIGGAENTTAIANYLSGKKTTFTIEATNLKTSNGDSIFSPFLTQKQSLLDKDAINILTSAPLDAKAVISLDGFEQKNSKFTASLNISAEPFPLSLVFDLKSVIKNKTLDEAFSNPTEYGILDALQFENFSLSVMQKKSFFSEFIHNLYLEKAAEGGVKEPAEWRAFNSLACSALSSNMALVNKSSALSVDELKSILLEDMKGAGIVKRQIYQDVKTIDKADLDSLLVKLLAEKSSLMYEMVPKKKMTFIEMFTILQTQNSKTLLSEQNRYFSIRFY